MAAKIRQNDEVIVLAGKDKGKKGKVTKVLATGKVIVEGINLVKKHQKPVPAMVSKVASLSKKQRSTFLTLRFSTQKLVKQTASVSVSKMVRKFVSLNLTTKSFLTN